MAEKNVETLSLEIDQTRIELIGHDSEAKMRPISDESRYLLTATIRNWENRVVSGTMEELKVYDWMKTYNPDSGFWHSLLH